MKIPATFRFFALAALPMLRSPAEIGALPALWFGAMPTPWFEALPALWFGALPAPWIGAFILTASKSKINDETPLNSRSLRGRSSLFRDIAISG